MGKRPGEMDIVCAFPSLLVLDPTPQSAISGVFQYFQATASLHLLFVGKRTEPIILVHTAMWLRISVLEGFGIGGYTVVEGGFRSCVCTGFYMLC